MTLCPGNGLEVRLKDQCPCRTRSWNSYLGCGGEGYDVKSCISCGISTCDECRIHVTYQVHVEDPGLDSRRWWTGYVLSCPFPVGLYPPKGPDNASWYLPPGLRRSHHDQGRLHAALEDDVIANPEPIERILDINLGHQRITPSGRTALPFDGNSIVATLNAMTASR
jgi:hypothetical protein